jgi:hypothetical protein
MFQIKSTIAPNRVSRDASATFAGVPYDADQTVEIISSDVGIDSAERL